MWGAKHTADDRFQVYIGIVNPTATEAEYDIIAYGSDFNFLADFGCANDHVRVPPFSMVQLSDPLAGWQGGEWSAASIVVKCKTDGAGGFAYRRWSTRPPTTRSSCAASSSLRSMDPETTVPSDGIT